MTPCPESAMPVVEWIRREVKRPEGMPHASPHRSACGRWAYLRWSKTCPMGMLPDAYSCTPSEYTDFRGVPGDVASDEIRAFANWWDSLPQSDAQEAVDFIWPVK